MLSTFLGQSFCKSEQLQSDTYSDVLDLETLPCRIRGCYKDEKSLLFLPVKALDSTNMFVAFTVSFYLFATGVNRPPTNHIGHDHIQGGPAKVRPTDIFDGNI